MKEYVRMSTIANVLLVVVLPVVALIGLNTALLHELKKQKDEPLLTEKDSLRNTKDRGQERKVALTVCAIVGCFILTQVK
jgi:predicted histidine transporter YuiF (NhaC family)